MDISLNSQMSSDKLDFKSPGAAEDGPPKPPAKPKKPSLDGVTLESRKTLYIPRGEGGKGHTSAPLDILQKYVNSRNTITGYDTDILQMIPTKPSRKPPTLPESSGQAPMPPPKPLKISASRKKSKELDEKTMKEIHAATTIQNWYRSMKIRLKFRGITRTVVAMASSTRKDIVQDYVTSERNFVRNLTVLCQFFMNPLVKLVGTKQEILSAQESATIFSNIETILGIHKKSLLEVELRSNRGDHVLLGDIYLYHAENLSDYDTYLRNYEKAVFLFQKKKESPSFAAFLNLAANHPISGRLSLTEHIFHPIARLNRLKSDVDRLISVRVAQTEGSDDENLLIAQRKFSAFLSTVKEVKEKAENTHKILRIENKVFGSPFTTLLDKERTYIMDDMFMRRHASGQVSSRHLFLFSDMLISTFYVKHPTTPLQFEKYFALDKIALEFGSDGALPRTLVVKEDDHSISFTANDHETCSKWVETIVQKIRNFPAGIGSSLIGDTLTKMLDRDQREYLRAAYWGQFKEVQKFVEKGVPLNTKNSDGMTALHFATQEGKLKIVKYLLEKGAEVNFCAVSGDTPLHIAAMNDHTKIVAYLLDHGADSGIKNSEGKQPIDFSQKKTRKVLLNRDVLDISKITDADDNASEIAENVPAEVAAKLMPLDGEIFLWSSDAYHLSPEDAQNSATGVSGNLFLSNYRLIFVSFEWLLSISKSNSTAGYSISTPVCLIERVEKHGHKSMGKGTKQYSIHLLTKTMGYLIYGFERESDSRRRLFKLLTAYENRLFAFFHTFSLSTGPQVWSVYDFVHEFERQDALGESWRITTVNKDYKLIPTYPPYLVVPAMVTDDLLRMSARFRSKGRIPCLSWKHPDTSAVICRSAQPLVGILGARQADDEMLVEEIRKTNNTTTDLIIVDARPRVNAVANQAKGAGYESTEKYGNTKLVFLGIENIHAVRESCRRVFELCTSCAATVDDDSHFLSALESSRWLHYIRAILNGAAFVAETVEARGCSVLVHCSDGWDRTAQITALSMLMLDPFYRTFLGFEVLIEKEWISFGHKFHDRCAHGDINSESDQRSQVFFQFIDCTWQLTRQFPRSFEFNSKFLLEILKHVYSCRFGNFLFNNEKVRTEKNLKEITSSLWNYLNSQLPSFKNKLYHHDSLHTSPILPDCRIHQLQLWDELFMKTVRRRCGYGHGGSYGTQLPESITEIYTQLANENESLLNKVKRMERQRVDY